MGNLRGSETPSPSKLAKLKTPYLHQSQKRDNFTGSRVCVCVQLPCLSLRGYASAITKV